MQANEITVTPQGPRAPTINEIIATTAKYGTIKLCGLNVQSSMSSCKVNGNKSRFVSKQLGTLGLTVFQLSHPLASAAR